MSLRGKVEIFGLTDRGRVREHNEDFIGSNPELGLAVLADGMGGLKAGEVASAMAVELVTAELQKKLPRVDSAQDDDVNGYSAESLAICDAIAHGRLADVPVEWDDVATVGVVMASGGYPGTYTTGHPIEGISDIDDDVQVFIAGAKRDQQGRLVTAGGRVLCVVARGATVAEARARAYDNVRRIRFKGAYYRTDIAARADEPLSIASPR